MKIRVPFVFLLPLVAFENSGIAAPTNGSAKDAAPTFRFADVEYFHRWSNSDQHEFTPREQTDLKRWADMVTVHHYRQVTSADGLAQSANAVLENYKNHRALVVKTDSIARTAQKPAEHLIVVLFPRPDFIEAVFARFKLVNGVGTAVIYSHREYGAKIGDQMSAWLKANGPGLEKTLMAWEKFPALTASKS
jgi:hypothetical protein